MRRAKEGYYHNENSRVRKERPAGARRKFVWGIFDVLMLVLTICVAVALIVGLLSRVVSPEKSAVVAFAGLFYPIVYVANIFCAFWWVVRWSRWVVLPALCLLIGAGSMGTIYRSDVNTKPEVVDVSRDDVVVASYNVMNFSDDGAPEGVINFERVAEWINQSGAQLLCLQEAHFSSGQTFEEFKQSLRRLSYGYFAESLSEGSDNMGSGFAMFSTWPIVRRGVACADSVAVHSVWADVKIGRDTIRVFNNHLQSTGISAEERSSTLHPSIARDTMAGRKLFAVADKVAENYRLRAKQAEEVAEAIAASPHAVVVCGDFNDTPTSYVYRTVRGGGLVDAFVEKGRGMEYTFKGLYNLFRIDYVLADEEHFYVKSYASYDEPMSDHKPVVVRLGRIAEE